MKNKIILYLLLITSVITSCQNYSIDGHWHIKRESILIKEYNLTSTSKEMSYDQEVILDIENDEGTWNRNKYDYGGIPLYIDKIKKSIEISNGECFRSEYKYELNFDSLKLFSSDGNLQFIGAKCDQNCCDKQADEFIDNNLIIDLPIVIDSSLSKKYNIYRPYEQRIFIGRPKLNYFGCSPSPTISVNNKYISLNEIPIVIEMNKVKIPFSSRNQIQYSLYSDKNVKIYYLIALIQKLKDNGITEIKLAVREDTNLEKEFKLRLRNLRLEEIHELSGEMSLSEFVEGKVK